MSCAAPIAVEVATDFGVSTTLLIDVGVTGCAVAASVLGVVPSAPGAAAEFRLPAPSLVEIGKTGKPEAVGVAVATDADLGVTGRF